MKSYELDLKKGDYIPYNQKKLFKYAIDWCLKNNWNSCRVNRTYYNFDFDKLEVSINGVGYGNYSTFKIKEIII